MWRSRRGFLRRAVFAAALVAIVGSLSPVAEAGNRVPTCGGLDEPACTIFEAIPSCDDTIPWLFENFADDPNRCRALPCGAEGDRPCTIVEHVPSCYPGLVEAPLGVRCSSLDGDGYPSYCGDELEPACTLDVQLQLGITSCKPELIEYLEEATCYAYDADGYPGFCGDDGEPACAITLQTAGLITACKPGVTEVPGFPLGSCEYTPIPEPALATTAQVVPAAGQPIFGIADLHGHVFSNLGFGGRFFHGEPKSPYGVAGALPDCWLSHGPGGSLDLIGDALNETVGHTTAGYPDLVDWPSRDHVQHQQMYHRWIERAHRGGLRLLVLNAVNNSVLCDASIQRPGYGCDDMDAVDRQIDAAWALKEAIDDEAGGPGQGWLDIALSGAHARQIIEAGKLAIVLGIEVDELFGCDPDAACTTASVLAGLDAYHARGVRHVFPIHLFDNAFGGAALYNDFFDPGNYLAVGSFFSERDCGGEGYTYQLGGPTADLIASLLGVPPRPTPIPAAGHCNSQGLSPLGQALVEGLIARKMIIDVDHMSRRMIDSVLDLVEIEAYPVVAGHTGFLDVASGEKRSEYQRTAQQVQRIRDLGGLVAPILEQGTASEIDYPAGLDRVANTCDQSSRSWAQAYLYASDAMAGSEFLHAVPMGTDLNGFIQLPAPRFGPKACDGNAAQSQDEATRVVYPFAAHDQLGSFDRLSTGNRTWDLNEEGFANVGLLPDFVEDLKQVGMNDGDLGPLFRSAEAYVAMWQRIDGGPECGDGVDNDFDGAIDGDDPGCESASDWSERSSAIACDDGDDNDGDGTVDGGDPDCSDPDVEGEGLPVPEPDVALGLVFGAFGLGLLRRPDRAERPGRSRPGSGPLVTNRRGGRSGRPAIRPMS